MTGQKKTTDITDAVHRDRHNQITGTFLAASHVWQLNQSSKRKHMTTAGAPISRVIVVSDRDRGPLAAVGRNIGEDPYSATSTSTARHLPMSTTEASASLAAAAVSYGHGHDITLPTSADRSADAW
jgi:hypothetical protein